MPRKTVTQVARHSDVKYRGPDDASDDDDALGGSDDDDHRVAEGDDSD